MFRKVDAYNDYPAQWVILQYSQVDSSFWKADVWLMDTVFKTKAETPALPRFFCMTCEQVGTLCN